MSDESLQLAVNSIQYFLSCHHYLHSPSAPKAAPCPTVAGITPGENMRNPAVNKVRKQVFCSNQSRGLLMPDAPYLVAVDVRSHKLKCHPFSLNPGWKTEAPVKRWNTPDALICSLAPAGVGAGPRHDACPLTRCSQWRRATDWIFRSATYMTLLDSQ